MTVGRTRAAAGRANFAINEPYAGAVVSSLPVSVRTAIASQRLLDEGKR